MSAEILRRAAEAIRDEWADGHDPMGTAWHQERDFHRAVALLLENESHAWDSQDAADPEGDRPWLINYARRDLLTSVAQTYLGETS